jgi:hypothetical protein
MIPKKKMCFSDSIRGIISLHPPGTMNTAASPRQIRDGKFKNPLFVTRRGPDEGILCREYEVIHISNLSDYPSGNSQQESDRVW